MIRITLKIISVTFLNIFVIKTLIEIIYQFADGSSGMSTKLNIPLVMIATKPLRYIVCNRKFCSPHLMFQVIFLFLWQFLYQLAYFITEFPSQFINLKILK